jgi:hypothetical protein
VIAPSFVGSHHRIEALRVKIAEIDLMASFGEPFQRRSPDRGMKALGQRVAIEVEDLHPKRRAKGNASAA